jgi:DNA-binding transcriptional LysR family regulator
MAHLLDSDQLRTFVAIVDSGSFTRAADVVHKTQSAVSMQIKRLEERIGRPLFERDGRQARLTEDGERVLDYARRIVRLNLECVTSFTDADLKGRVRLGVPDDYAERYLPEILARFSRSNPQAEVTVVCEPTPNLVEMLQAGDLDLAIITHIDRRGPAEIVRVEQLLWVTSARHQAHEEAIVPLALGRPTCVWRQSATEALERSGRPFRVLYASWNSTAVGAAVMAGLAVSVLPESAVRAGMRILGQSDGFPPLPTCRIGLLRGSGEVSPLMDALADHIVQSLDNLSSLRPALDQPVGHRPSLAAE